MCWEQRITYYPCVIDSLVWQQKFDCGLQENWVWICLEQVISTLQSHAEREKTNKLNPENAGDIHKQKSSEGNKQKEKVERGAIWTRARKISSPDRYQLSQDGDGRRLWDNDGYRKLV